MSFKIAYKEEDECSELRVMRLKNRTNSTKVDILPDFGAMLHRFSVRSNSSTLDFNVIDRYPDLDTLMQELKITHKGAKLSPFACRIDEDKYHFDGHDFLIRSKRNPVALHGLLFDKPFHLTEKILGKDFCQAKFLHCYQGHENKGFPFRYQCEVIYTLYENDRLHIETIITNLSDKAMPLVDGWCPYFSLGCPIDELEISFQSKSLLELNEHRTPTEKVFLYRNFNEPCLLGDTVFDHIFILDWDRSQPMCSLKNPKTKIQVNIYPERSYPILQIYTPPTRTSIAIANLSGAPDAFNNGIGLKVLQPYKTLSFATTFEVLKR